jgi:hypothetical protein
VIKVQRSCLAGDTNAGLAPFTICYLLFASFRLKFFNPTKSPESAKMTVREYHTEQEVQQSPWVQTPLRESYALSEAAGWYGHISSSSTVSHPALSSTHSILR